MLSDSSYVDGSWELKVEVCELNLHKSLRVTGSLHIGGLMHQVVEKLDIKQDWSDHAFWWPTKNAWLLRTRSTLDQYGVQSDTELQFLRMHNNIQILLPSLTTAIVRVNFSSNVFNVTSKLCKEFNIRHPEELSLMFPLSKSDLKRNNPTPVVKGKAQSNQHRVLKQQSHEGDLSGSGNLLTPTLTTPGYMTDGASPMLGRQDYGKSSGSVNHLAVPTLSRKVGSSTLLPMYSMNSLYSIGIDSFRYAEHTNVAAKSALSNEWVLKTKNLTEKARLNATWLDSSRSIMEQGIRPPPTDPDGRQSPLLSTLYLRFKFFTFYDLCPKYDAVRIHQLYEQARWSLLTNQTECTEDEMFAFASLQLQAELQYENPQTEESPVEESDTKSIDEVDGLLAELEMNCLGEERPNSPVEQTTVIPELEANIKIYKVKSFGIKSFKKCFAVIRETKLYIYKSQSESKTSKTESVYSLRGSDIEQDINISNNKFVIKLTVSVKETKEELLIKFVNQEEFANWFAAFRLTSRGKTLASKSAYNKEVKSVLDVLAIQTPGPQPVLSTAEISSRLSDLSNYVSGKLIKKSWSKDHIRNHIAETHAVNRQLSLLESKMKYISAWQSLHRFGNAYFLVRFDDESKEELLAVSFNRIVLQNSNTGDSNKTWYFTEMRSWRVNWDKEKIIIDFKNDKISFTPLSANCKTVMEFIGGYVFLNQRTPEKNQDINETLFHRLTGAPDS